MTDHHPDCAWERATCEYKATHHYCPHPEHACTCPPAPKAGPVTDLTIPALREAMAALSGRERAEHVLAFREAHAPNNPRFHHRAMLVDNGGRGSDQQAVTFDADDLSALMMDLVGTEFALTTAEKERDALRAALARWKRIRTPTHGNCCTCQACGELHDDCRCDLDEVADELAQTKAALARARAVLDSAELVIWRPAEGRVAYSFDEAAWLAWREGRR